MYRRARRDNFGFPQGSVPHVRPTAPKIASFAHSFLAQALDCVLRQDHPPFLDLAITKRENLGLCQRLLNLLVRSHILDHSLGLHVLSNHQRPALLRELTHDLGSVRLKVADRFIWAEYFMPFLILVLNVTKYGPLLVPPQLGSALPRPLERFVHHEPGAAQRRAFPRRPAGLGSKSIDRDIGAGGFAGDSW